MAAKKKSAPKKKTNGKPAGAVEDGTFINLSPDEVTARVKKARGYLAALRAELKGLVRYSKQSRLSSLGRFRDGEEEAIEAVMDMVDARPASFAALAAKDNGVDDTVVETQPSRDDLARREALKPLLKDLTTLKDDVGDTYLALGDRPRRFSIAAYSIGAANAPHDPALASAIAPAKRFYASRGRPKATEPAEEPAADEASDE